MFKSSAIALFLAGITLFSSVALSEPVSKSYWGAKAIGGHDTVAYHQDMARVQHREVLGDQRFKVKYLGANWLFASQSSADKFEANPQKYAPLFNGFCANALRLGEGLIPTSGKVWEFFGDELYMFYAGRGRTAWLEGDWRLYKKHAQQAWLGLTATAS